MWRIYRRVDGQISPNVSYLIRCATKPLRQQSTSSGRSKKGKLLLALTGSSVAVVGGTTLYAKYDPAFQKWLLDRIPPSVTDVFGIGSEISVKESPSISKPPSLTKTIPEKTLKEKSSSQPVKEEPKVGHKTPKEPQLKKAPEKAPVSSSEDSKPVAATSSYSLEPQPMSEEALYERLTGQELEEAAENAALEQILTDSIRGLKTASKDAFIAHDNALKGVKCYMELLERSLDETEKKGALGIQLNSAAMKKAETLKQAELKTLKAKEQVEKLKNVIANGKDSRLTKNNSSLMAAEELLKDLTYQIQSAESLTLAGKTDCTIMVDYCDLVEKSRHEYQKELQALMPEVNLTEKGKKLTEEELNHLLTHAHHRLEQIQKQLAKQQASEKQRFQRLFESQQNEQEKNVQLQITMELEKTQSELNLSFQKKLAQLREEYEQELRIQLRRQAAAHSDHLQDVIQLQHSELQGHFRDELQGKLEQAKRDFEAGLARSYARLKGIEEGMKAKAESNMSAKMSQQLWLACQSLKKATSTGLHSVTASEQQPRPLASALETVKNSADANHALVAVVLNAIPKQATDRGIYPESSLKERYLKVYRICRRVALIDEHGGSLVRFALSYLQSILILDHTIQAASKDLVDQAFDPSQLTTFDILARAKCCVDRDDLEQALRYMNMLKGASRVVADDWIKEARLTLETRQAADALIALSSVLGVQGCI